MPLGQRALRLAVRALQAGAPPVAVWAAERLFFTPPRSRLTPDTRALLDRGARFTLQVEGRRVVGWSWGGGRGPIVALVHGWGGRGGRMGVFVEPLLARGFRVVTHDGPGHGVSAGRMSSMPELARALRAVAAHVGPLHAIVAHSLGGSAATLALTEGLTVRSAVFLAPAADPAEWTEAFARQLGFSAATIEGMKRRSSRRLRFDWDAIHVADLARRQTAPLLIMHDRGDQTVPWSDGAAIAAAWPGAELVSTTGLGHREIVRDPAVVQRSVDFVVSKS